MSTSPTYNICPRDNGSSPRVRGLRCHLRGKVDIKSDELGPLAFLWHWQPVLEQAVDVTANGVAAHRDRVFQVVPLGDDARQRRHGHGITAIVGVTVKQNGVVMISRLMNLNNLTGR